MFSRSSSRLGCVGSQPSASRVWALEEGWSIAKIGPSGPKVSCGTDSTGRPSRRPMTVGDVAHRVALVGHGVPGRSRPVPTPAPAGTGRPRRARARPASAGCRRPGSRTRRYGARCRSAGRRTRPCPRCGPCAAGGRPCCGPRVRPGPGAPVTERPRPPTGPSVGSGSASVEARPGTHGVPETVTSGRSLPTSSSPSAARAALSSATARARASGLLKSLLKARWITPSARAAPARRTSRSARSPRSGSAPAASSGQRGRVGAGEREDGVAVAEQFGDDGGADQAGAAGDEDVHERSPRVMRPLSHHRTP